MSIYRVLDRWRYREHELGETFIADLDPDVERRAVELRVIEVLQHGPTRLDPDKAKPPAGWQVAA